MAETMQAVVKAHASPGLEVQQVPIPTINISTTGILGQQVECTHR